MPEVEFHNDFQHKVMIQTFAAGSVIATEEDIRAWRKLWMAQLSPWHTPYKALIDCEHLTLAANPDLKTTMTTMISFFQKLFLRKVAGVNQRPDRNHELLPFPLYPTFEAGQKALGIRTTSSLRASNDLRSQIVIQNHFRQQVVELGFSQTFVLDDAKKLTTLKDKLFSNLRQWHSKWSLLIDCANFSITEPYRPAFQNMEASLQRYFLQQTAGYNLRQNAANFPFPAFRSRHKAAKKLETANPVAGDEAHCQSKPRL